MVMGQSVGSSREAIRAEYAGVCDYATIRKRNILTAKEKALRCSDDHPARIAVSNNDTKQRLAIREGFRSNANKLAEYLPYHASEGKSRTSPSTQMDPPAPDYGTEEVLHSSPPATSKHPES